MTERQIIAALVADPDSTAALQAARAYLDAPVTPMEGTGDVWADLIELTGYDDPLRPHMHARRGLGVANYGRPLRYGAGLDYRREALEELLDAAGYMHAAGGRFPVCDTLDIARRLL